MRFIVKMNWLWGSGRMGPPFHEVFEFRASGEHFMDEIAEAVERKVREIARRFAFDCGRLTHPLNPYIGRIEIVPVEESWDVSMEDLGLNGLMEDEIEHTRTLIEEGRRIVDGECNMEPAPGWEKDDES
jgi:hypothetical protein